MTINASQSIFLKKRSACRGFPKILIARAKTLSLMTSLVYKTLAKYIAKMENKGAENAVV